MEKSFIEMPLTSKSFSFQVEQHTDGQHCTLCDRLLQINGEIFNQSWRCHYCNTLCCDECCQSDGDVSAQWGDGRKLIGSICDACSDLTSAQREKLRTFMLDFNR